MRVWDLATGQAVAEPLVGHSGEVLAVALSDLHGSPIAVTGSWDATVRVWDLATGQAVAEPLIGHSAQVNAVAVSDLHDSPIAVTSSWDATMRIWDLATGRTCEIIKLPSGSTAIAVANRRAVVAFGKDIAAYDIRD